MSNIEIRKISITKLSTDVIVNAANEGLLAGGGVCGAIFRGAGVEKLTAACRAIGSCKTGHAVITEGFNLPLKYIIHAVGPIWNGGTEGEPELLYRAYKSSLILAMDNACHSIAFPLILAGIYGYPLRGAWEQAIRACTDFIEEHSDYEMEILFAVLDDHIMSVGQQVFFEKNVSNISIDT